MDEAATGLRAVEQTLIRKSLEDESFRQRLLADPKATIEQEMGTRLPEEVEIRAVEETPETIYLVLPPKAAATQGGDELSDRELEAVAGGGEDLQVPPGYTLQCISTKSKKGCDKLP